MKWNAIHKKIRGIVLLLLWSIISQGKVLLIVCPQAYQVSLQPYLSYRRNQGWNVQIIVPDKADCAVIRHQISCFYWENKLKSGHLLLIGDETQIPYWQGRDGVVSKTDWYYACMDGKDDCVADWAYGRIPAVTSAELSAYYLRLMKWEEGEEPDGCNLTCIVSGDYSAEYQKVYAQLESSDVQTPVWQICEINGLPDKNCLSEFREAIADCIDVLLYFGRTDDNGWQNPTWDIDKVQAEESTGFIPVVYCFATAPEIFFADQWLLNSEHGCKICGILSPMSAVDWRDSCEWEKMLFVTWAENPDGTYGEIFQKAKKSMWGVFSDARGLQLSENYYWCGDPTMTPVKNWSRKITDYQVYRCISSCRVAKKEQIKVLLDVCTPGEKDVFLLLREKLPYGWQAVDFTWNGNAIETIPDGNDMKCLLNISKTQNRGELLYSLKTGGYPGACYCISGEFWAENKKREIVGDQEIEVINNYSVVDFQLEPGWNLLFPKNDVSDMEIQVNGNEKIWKLDPNGLGVWVQARMADLVSGSAFWVFSDKKCCSLWQCLVLSESVHDPEKEKRGWQIWGCADEAGECNWQWKKGRYQYKKVEEGSNCALWKFFP